jgi:4-amino-4-deoxy-L-arabinose transferase-like glycosyltransferase
MNPSASIRPFSSFGENLRRHAEALRVVGLAAAALMLYLFELGKGALPDWDSAIYAEVSKEMLRGHHWLTPYWDFKPFFEKPPLLYWVQIASFRLFGMNELAARLPSALAGVGIVLLVYAIVRRMAGPLAGVFAGFVLLTTHLFDHVMRQGTTDALLVLLIYVTVYGYVRLRDGDGRWFYLVCAGLGLGILDKGPAALVAPMAIGVDWFFRRREKKLISGRQFWLGMLLLSVIVLPWHIWMVAKFGWAFLNTYIGYHILERATRPLEGNGGGLLSTST